MTHMSCMPFLAFTANRLSAKPHGLHSFAMLWWGNTAIGRACAAFFVYVCDLYADTNNAAAAAEQTFSKKSDM